MQHPSPPETVPAAAAAGEVLRAEGVGVTLLNGARILRPTTLAVAPGELLALMGPSGSGKTTLLKLLAGVTAPSEGTVRLGEDDVGLRTPDLGYVSQHDAVHEFLTAREALRYAARLRVTGAAARGLDLDALVADVLDELDLTTAADTRIGSLSGGQRKRTAFGVELVARPTMLLLDEPTSGLDPGLERRLMATLRELADQGRGIVVVTHATASLTLCDRVAVMRPGGELGAVGSPAEALAAFGLGPGATVAGPEAAGRAARGGTPAAASAAVGDGSPVAQAAPRDDAPAPLPFEAIEGHAARSPGGHRLGAEVRTLASRYARTLLRDQRTLLVLLGQAPIIAVLIAILFRPDLLARPDVDPARSAQLLFLLLTGSIWLGVISACREVVKERTIVMRELAAGVRLDAYVLAKAGVLFALTALQVALLLGVLVAFQPLHEPASTYLAVLGLCTGTAWVAAGMGLAVSAVARSVDQATSFVPLLLIHPLLFAGALVPFAQMPRAIGVVADLTFARWAYAGLGALMQVNDRLADDSGAGEAAGFGRAFFAPAPGTAVLALVAFGLAFLLLTALLLARQPLDDD